MGADFWEYITESSFSPQQFETEFCKTLKSIHFDFIPDSPYRLILPYLNQENRSKILKNLEQNLSNHEGHNTNPVKIANESYYKATGKHLPSVAHLF